MNRFDEKVVLITGAARGIGAAAAELMAREGAQVMVTDTNVKDVQLSIAAMIGEDLKVEAAGLDVTKEQDWDVVIDDLMSRFGRLDVLINNAGVGWAGSVEDCTLEDWRAINAVNSEGVFLGTQKAIKVMKETGGSIVNVSSVAGIIGEPALAAYGASKGAVRTFTKTAAVHCANAGYPIRINSLHPGYTETKMVNDLIENTPEAERAAFVEHAVGMIAMKRLAKPMEIAKPLVFLASEDASYMTGSELVVDGGYIAA